MKKLLTLFALPALLCLMPMTAMAEVINTVTSSETITKTSTVYVGEVVVDGVTQIKYLYSGDITTSNIVIQNLLDALNGMADGDYAALLEEHEFDYGSQTTGFAICSNPDLVATMDGNWSSAQYVGTLYYPDKTVTSEINSNLYDIDEGFKAVLDSKTQYRIENIDTPADAEKCIVTQIDSNSNSSVYYTVEDGEIIKHVDTHVVFLSEATTVIYTKVELATATTTQKGDVNGDGNISITDVTMLVDVILTGIPQNTDTSIYDINGDGDVTVSDVTVLVDNILNGNGSGIGDTSQAYLTCPDDHHPHMIDLGLESGTKWACCNVGATTPEGYGGYYAWGETEMKDYYSWETYNHCDGSYDTCHNLGSDIAGTGYDVAHVKWGGSWVMPSSDQIEELLDNCDHEWTTANGVNGRKFTSKTNGGSIFLPAAGYRWADNLLDAGICGGYWSSTQDPSYSSYAYYLCLYSADASCCYDYSFRLYGHRVRPVVTN